MGYFSSSYYESSERFRILAATAGATLSQYEHPNVNGSDGKPLAVDVALFGREDARKIFFNINGVHGLESYPGAAAQLALLESGSLENLPDDCSVVLIHNLNPFGWAYHCQRNENNADINRNFIDFENAPKAGEIIDEIAGAIAIEDMSLGALHNATQKLYALSSGDSGNAFSKAIMVGQFENPESLKFGGFKPEWSNDVLRKIAGRYLTNAERIVFLDWHTGLGDYGTHFYLPFWQEGTESWDSTVRMWGEEGVRTGSAGIMNDPDASDDASSSQINGLTLQAIVDAKPDAVVCGGVIEVGTVPFELIVQATILDHWVRQKIGDDSPEIRYWREQTRTMFAPRDPWWAKQVLELAAKVYEKMLTELTID